MDRHDDSISKYWIYLECTFNIRCTLLSRSLHWITGYTAQPADSMQITGQTSESPIPRRGSGRQRLFRSLSVKIADRAPKNSPNKTHYEKFVNFELSQYTCSEVLYKIVEIYQLISAYLSLKIHFAIFPLSKPIPLLQNHFFDFWSSSNFGCKATLWNNKISEK